MVNGSLLGRLSMIVRLFVGGLVQAIVSLAYARGGDVVYLPYPAPFTGWWLAAIPQRWRPCCVADAYVSLWDSMFRDRGGGNLKGWKSRVVHGFERRALHAMELILVDTEANEQQIAIDFALPQSKVKSVPLAIPELEHALRIDAVDEQSRPLRVLFVGTLAPLHGIDVVLGAAARLADDARVEFRLVGDGQQGPLVERFVGDHELGNFTWVRQWQSLEAIAGEISSADVCLGVFSGEGKASRVLPFKLYYALAAGKAVITQKPYSLPRGIPPIPAITIETDDPDQRISRLVEAILLLVNDRAHAKGMGDKGYRYFHDHLSGDAIVASWESLRA